MPTKRGRRERHESRHGVPGPKSGGTPTPGPVGPPGKRERPRGRPGSSRHSHARERSNLLHDTSPREESTTREGGSAARRWARTRVEPPILCARSSRSRRGSAEVHRRDQSESPSRVSMPWCVNSTDRPQSLQLKYLHIGKSCRRFRRQIRANYRDFEHATPKRASPRDEVAARFTSSTAFLLPTPRRLAHYRARR